MTSRAASRRGDATTRQRVAEVFSGNGFRRLFAARAVSQFGDGIFQLAAASVLLFEDPGPNPALAMAGITVLTLVPFSVISPFVGVFIDRWERRTILVWVPLIRAAVAASIPVAILAGSRGWAYYAVVLFVLSANRFFLATMSAVLPQLVPEDDLLVANTVASTGGSVTNVVGQAVGALVSGAIGGANAAAFAGIAFAAGGILAFRVPVHRGFIPERAPLLAEVRAVLGEMRAGIRTVRHAPRVVYALSGIGLLQILVGAMTGVLVYFFIAVERLEVRAGMGILAVLATGIGLGVLLVPLVGRAMRTSAILPVGLAIGALGNALAAARLDRTGILPGTVLVGISYAFAKIPVDTMVQEDMADAFRGRAFAVYDMLFNLARVGGVVVVAAAYERGADSERLISAIVVAFLIAAAFFTFWERRIGMGPFRRARKRARIQPLEELLLPGELVTVRAYAGARADEEPRAVVVGGRELPVEEIVWRAVVEREGRRTRAFVVRIRGRHVRLSHREDEGTWEVERILPSRPASPNAS